MMTILYGNQNAPRQEKMYVLPTCLKGFDFKEHHFKDWIGSKLFKFQTHEDLLLCNVYPATHEIMPDNVIKIKVKSFFFKEKRFQRLDLFQAIQISSACSITRKISSFIQQHMRS